MGEPPNGAEHFAGERAKNHIAPDGARFLMIKAPGGGATASSPNVIAPQKTTHVFSFN
jgi:hypothetical protein